ncbi:dynactin subunit 4 [Chaetomium sp. MPI-SDFR-AT-0129]|nr:dynactin subunit 4 [Chaetomium sp. MPI-SDFR-AT-0129]
MAALTPYTFIQCPCSDSSTLGRPSDANPAANAANDDDEEADEDNRTFDPRAPRSNFSLYPLEYLLYCEDCHQIRCPRCVSEEIASYYCPSCLFEVPSSNLKSEGNRCTRNCFQCPICIGPLAVTSVETKPDPSLLAAPDNAAAPHSGPYALTCSYCHWTSTEAGLKFDRPNNIHAQLTKLRNGGLTRLTARERRERRKDPAYRAHLAAAAAVAVAAASEDVDDLEERGRGPGIEEKESLDVETQFANLKSFYQAQLANPNSSDTGLTGLGDLGFSSPTSLSRIMSIYTGGSLRDKKAKSRVGAMREALDADEGFQPARLDESAAIAALQAHGFDGTSSTAQLAEQPVNLGEPAFPQGQAHFASDLRPVPHLLRTKRSKRCPVCRHIISKPEAKVQTTRFRIRLVAGSYIPSIAIRPLALSPIPNASSSFSSTSAPIPASASASGPAIPGALLEPLRPAHFVLTFKNPIFETVKITLGAPAHTPGRFSSKVTVLCPEFQIDANTDVWDEALKEGLATTGGGAASGERDPRERRRRRGGTEDGSQSGINPATQLEVGKIWERGRNWVSIVVEVVPPSLSTLPSGGGDTGLPLQEDEDVLEIPLFVRVEWEAEMGGDEVGSSKEKGEGREKRELAYWCVLGLGRIRR